MHKWSGRLMGLAILSTILSGCGFSHYQPTGTRTQDTALTATVQHYLTIRAQHNWPQIGPYLTGDALAALQSSIASINHASATDTLQSVQIIPKWVSPDGTLAVVEAHYLLSRSVSNTGTTVDAITSVLNLAYLSGQWRIYSISTVTTTPQP